MICNMGMDIQQAGDGEHQLKADQAERTACYNQVSSGSANMWLYKSVQPWTICTIYTQLTSYIPPQLSTAPDELYSSVVIPVLRASQPASENIGKPVQAFVRVTNLLHGACWAKSGHAQCYKQNSIKLLACSPTCCVGSTNM